MILPRYVKVLTSFTASPSRVIWLVLAVFTSGSHFFLCESWNLFLSKLILHCVSSFAFVPMYTIEGLSYLQIPKCPLYSMLLLRCGGFYNSVNNQKKEKVISPECSKFRQLHWFIRFYFSRSITSVTFN